MSTNPVPAPDWMLPDFDASSVKVSDLRAILLENNIPHSYTKKADLVQLFERQVKPMTAKLLKDHQSVKPSAVGIFDMRTGRYITEDPPAATTATTTTTRTPRKKASSIDQESLASTASKPRTRRSTAVRDSSAREHSVASEANGELTPQANPPRSRATRQKTQRESTQPESSPDKPTRRLGKRKASEQPLTSDSEVASEIDQLAHLSEEEEASNSSHRLPSSSINVTNSSVSPAPIKKRRSELPTQSTPNINPDHQQEPTLSKKSTSKLNHRRSTIYEAIEAGEGSFSDFNPFQTAPEEVNQSGSSSRKPRSSNSQSSVKRSSIAPAHLPRSSTTPNIFNVTSTAAQPNLASQQVPLSSHMSPHPHAAPSFLPKSVTTSNVHSLQTPARESIRRSGPFPSLPGNRRLTMTHLQDDLDGNVSFDQGNPEHIQQLLVPEENQNSSDGSIMARSRYSHAGGAVNHELPYQSIPTSVQSRRQSQLPPRTPYAQSLPHSSSNLQYETPLPRPQIQRVKLDELVHTSPDKKLKITKPFRRTLPKKNGPFAGPTQVISFLLRLGCLCLLFGAANWYLRQADRLGYCDTGMKSNAMTRDQRIDQFLQLDDMRFSDSEFASFADTFRVKLGQAFEAASAFGLLPDCQSCPPHAICEHGRIVRCELDFVQTHTDWEKSVHRWLPMLMGPKCLPDTAKLVKIVERANQLNHLLKKQRGKVLCSMGMRAADEQQSRAVKIKVYGLSESHVKDLMMISKPTDADVENQKTSSSWSEEEIVDLAIKDLERTGQVVRGEGFLATRDFKQMEMGLQCRIKLGVLKTIQKFKLVLMSAVLLLAGWLYIRLTFARLGQEKQKVRELVELALTKLRDESWLHHTNPALSPDPPTLASAQLRDLILSYDHSPVNRQKLWKKVEKIVEGNSNVRTKVSEMRGESIKVWEWIGNYKANLGLAHLASTGAPGSGSQPFSNSPDAHPPPPSS